ncbi:hypothetical protein BDA99DRAFT_10597 [Phascolomyces articulosus]|uniref:Uncharacterized protein n=1 Tax=Phascolomyces articulosus TaxID=60185 RepID=A0AAD5KZQ8_9FUNG|nr:hypothetical protein BDA99DRAFT_10597 [Phascolomyces articulosus]
MPYLLLFIIFLINEVIKGKRKKNRMCRKKVESSKKPALFFRMTKWSRKFKIGHKLTRKKKVQVFVIRDPIVKCI